jgi:hypothetical protein
MGYISTEDVAKKRQQLKEAFPDYKFSVRRENYSGITVTILEGSTQLLEEGENYENVNVYSIDRVYADRPQVKDVLEKIYSILDEGNKRRETGDYGTQPDFYIYLYIGESDKKPYKYVPKKTERFGKKEYKGGFKNKFSKESKTAGFELVYNCGNGWKVYRKTISEGEVPKYDYRVIKDYEVKPVGKEEFYSMKGDMLESGFQWSVKAQCFERSNVPFGLRDSFLESSVCGVLGKYFPKIGEAKSEAPTETPQPESTPTEMNLDQYIDDMQMLVELETDEEQRLSLLQYVNDLQTLKMLG